MIGKEHQTPIIIPKLEALLRRLSKYFVRRIEIESQLGKSKAGYSGELSLDYYLNNLPDKEYVILHDLRLKNKSSFFQIDTLILHRHFILILEVKNIAGDIYIDTNFNQMIRTLNGKTEVFPDPILQAYRQKVELERWLVENKCPSLSIEYLVVLTNPHTLIKNSPEDEHVFQRLVRSAKLPFKIETYTHFYPIPSLTSKESSKISKLLLKCHTPQTYDVLHHFNVSQTDIICGVYCVQCESIPMERMGGTWICSSCKSVQKDAHVYSLRDYAFLIQPTITNKEARGFLRLESVSATRKILQKMNLSTTGSTKDKRYDLTPLIEHPPSPPEKPIRKSSKKHNSQSQRIHKRTP
ncbi:nuclease-related domain-containing protein [Rossellomorea aquimaris]|uniref:nuclease-related domain-containing protein n=1 Tax=Rossellomorea aquimaris TaxID=189382 RepID=UPI0005C885B0|nr:nuclease-related domain-containing protein [Rossellomorea aquimaris]